MHLGKKCASSLITASSMVQGGNVCKCMCTCSLQIQKKHVGGQRAGVAAGIDAAMHMHMEVAERL